MQLFGLKISYFCKPNKNIYLYNYNLLIVRMFSFGQAIGMQFSWKIN